MSHDKMAVMGGVRVEGYGWSSTKCTCGWYTQALSSGTVKTLGSAKKFGGKDLFVGTVTASAIRNLQSSHNTKVPAARAMTQGQSWALGHHGLDSPLVFLRTEAHLHLHHVSHIRHNYIRRTH